MIALKVFPVIQVLLIIFTNLILGYPSSIYNTKHFRQSSQRSVYDPYNYYYSRTQRYPYEYYPSYTQVYPDEYYYNLQDSFPLYYISPRSSKYDPYQTTLPYYQDIPVPKSKYYNYGDSSYDDPEKVLQDIEREQRERSQPIGHEIRYEGTYNTDDDGTLDETSAAFLNNLVMQQMYQENLRGKTSGNYYEPTDYAPEYQADNDDIKVNKWNDVPYDRPVHFEDEEVQELKELPKKQQKEGRKNRQRKQRKLKNNEKRSQDDVVVFTDRKPVVKELTASSTSLPADETRRNTRGQKEEVMMRPATPVRHPFSESVLEMLNQQVERKRSPSVYDKIRHILEMEKNEENVDKTIPEDEVRPLMKKRIVSSEDSLTRQLSVLKKVQ